jgi:tRNA U34 5-carboxymethylaminomethyl modifying GTPase MnmE/TrmE
MKDLTDTICALSTPPGRSGLAVVRVSGSQAFPLHRRLFMTGSGEGSAPVRRATLGRNLFRLTTFLYRRGYV